MTQSSKGKQTGEENTFSECLQIDSEMAAVALASLWGAIAN